ncbi:MAG: FAD-dependent oxidoreductase [Alcanivorax sp.]|uniref:NAD(P)/FAD-dependent oxidoreductase n=1 Tax=Alcanivorax sp. TaxID=1872427 RepID=UPI00262920C0|nr:FAD-dependent oxidoreductase [Alcanivorax sp.]MDF1723483.1 FAD-dependent oxidoreductase [Alcanivorax sp.]
MPVQHETKNSPLLDAFRPQGGWMDPPNDLQPTLEGKVSANVVVVGAGFAGLSTALELAAKGVDVVVLEQEYAGFGASGRNAGYLAGSVGVEFDFFHKRVGLNKARDIVRFYDEGVGYVEQRLAELGIECDYNPSGIVRAGVHPSQKKRLLKTMELGLKLGSQTEFQDSKALRERGIPDAFLFGYYHPVGGTLDPGKYVAGLRRAALRAGIRIYEKTPVLSYSEGPVVTCKTEKGSASAPFLVLATNAYTPQLGLLKNKVVPVRVSAIETDPLTPSQRESLGWHGREGIMSSHWILESHRLTARNTLIVTTKRVNYAYGGNTSNVPDETAYRALATALHDRHPTLKGIGIKSCWSGYISVAGDALPVVGKTGAQQNIFYTAGCSGHGLATQSLMGKMLAERILGSEHELLAALQHKTPTLPPEPLQWCAFKMALGAAHTMDEITNRSVRSGKAGLPEGG